MSFLHLFQWFDATPISKVIRDSTYIFPVVEVLHLFGLTLLLGTVTVVSLRMLGIGMRRQSVAAVARQLTPWSIGAAILTILSGILLFLSEAMKCYGNAAFPYKMYFLLGGIVLYFIGQRRVVSANSHMGPIQLKVVAILSLVLWYGVAIAGRAIAFV
ncbi:MAG TPA: DUF6644 family protein [Bryobacteraceae bacterium]|jgi:hypothetical protein|nr:DUF6644 family protein [Bryobacteraceae bacterium]